MNLFVVVFGQVMINLIENRHNRIKNHLHNCFVNFRIIIMIKIVIDFVLLFVVVVDYILVVIVVFLTIITFIF